MVLSSLMQAYAQEIGDLLLRMPRPLLLLLKTNDCLRSVDMSLGQPVNTFVITARECTRALAELEIERSKGPLGAASAWLSGQLDRAHVELLMWIMTGLSVWARVKLFLGGGQRPVAHVEQEQKGVVGRDASTLPAELVAAG
jgi:aarF domain-containing kinase